MHHDNQIAPGLKKQRMTIIYMDYNPAIKKLLLTK